MRHPHPLLTLLLALTCLVATACTGGGQGRGNQDQVVTMATHETDVTTLRRLITLPEAPREVRWQTETLGDPDAQGPGPDDWALIAAVAYDDATFAQVEAALQAEPPGGDVEVAPDFVRDWFPEPLRSAFVPIAGSPNLALAAPHYSADRFARAPLLSGYVVVKAPWILIFLQTT